jgi:hypothetical protein
MKEREYGTKNQVCVLCGGDFLSADKLNEEETSCIIAMQLPTR